MLVEVAWHYQHSPRVSPVIARRHDQLPKAVTDIAWAAQLRLNAKFKRLVARRVMKNKAVVGVARELLGVLLRQASLPSAGHVPGPGVTDCAGQAARLPPPLGSGAAQRRAVQIIRQDRGQSLRLCPPLAACRGRPGCG